MKKQTWQVAFLLVVMLITMLGIPTQHGQAEDEVALSVRSIGLIDEDGTILYSVILGSGAANLTSLIITSTLPTGTTFIEDVVTPEGATFLGEKQGVVSWALDSLTGETILGPFTYRVKLDAEDTEIPLAPEAEVTWAGPSVGVAEAFRIAEEKLEAFADTAVISIDERGTVDEDGVNNAVAVGKTGIKVFIPAGSVKDKVDITFTRMAVGDQEFPEETLETTWWCAVLAVSFEPSNPLAPVKELPIVFTVPTRKTVTPGQPAVIFVENDEVWQAVNELPPTSWHMGNTFAKPSAEDTADYAFIDPTGSNVVVVTYNLWSGDAPALIALGTANPPNRAVSTTNLNTSLNITAGASSSGATMLPYVEQDNIIGVLIGVR